MNLQLAKLFLKLDRPNNRKTKLMQKLNLYKLSFSAELGVIANIIVAAK